MAIGDQTSQIQWWALPQQQMWLPSGVTQRQLTDYQRGLTQNMTPAMQDRISNFINQQRSTVPATSVTGTQNTPFLPVADQFNALTNQFQGAMPWVVNQIRALQNEYGTAMNAMDVIPNLYSGFESAMDPLYQNFMDINRNVGGSVVNQLLANRDNFMGQYWPQGEQRKRLDEYYMNLGNYLSSAAADDLAMLEAQGVQSWASLWAQRASRSQAMQQNLQRFVEAKQREVVDYDNLYKTLNQYEQEFIKQYADSNDKFIIDAYRNLINYKNAIGQNLLNAQQELLIAWWVWWWAWWVWWTGGAWAGTWTGTWTGTETGTGTGTGATTWTWTWTWTGTWTTTPTSPITSVRRLTPQEEMALNSPFLGDTLPLWTTTQRATQPAGSTQPVWVAVRQPNIDQRMLAPVSEATPTRPTIVPTPRQMTEYAQGRTANMSTALIRSIQYYRANPQEYANLNQWPQSSATPQQLSQLNAINTMNAWLASGGVAPLTPQQLMNLNSPLSTSANQALTAQAIQNAARQNPPVSEAVPTRPTIIPTQRQMQDYARWLTGGMSNALIRAIQYYRANPTQYPMLAQGSTTNPTISRLTPQQEMNLLRPMA